MTIGDPAGSFYYDRPLATLEPLAVKLGMDIWTKYGYSDIASLQSSLVNSARDGMTIFVAWEHTYLQRVVGDYDSLYIVHVRYGSTIVATFERDIEGLNGPVDNVSVLGACSNNRLARLADSRNAGWQCLRDRVANQFPI